MRLCLRFYSLAKDDLELELSWFQLLSAGIIGVHLLVGFMGELQGFLHVRHMLFQLRDIPVSITKPRTWYLKVCEWMSSFRGREKP